MVAGLVGTPLIGIGGVGSARADGYGYPTLQGALIVDNGAALVFTGVVSWGGAYTPISNGSEVFANVLVLYVYDLRGYDVNLTITLRERGQSTTQFALLTPGVATVVNVNLPSNPSWTPATLNIGGTLETYSVATPVSLLPPSIANVGGMDLLILVILSELLVAFAGALALASWLMSRAKWAPKFSLLIWGHVVLVTLGGTILIDYQWVDQTFAGWSPLVYVLFVTPMFFLFSLSLFNQAPRALLLRNNAPLAGQMSFNAWWMEVAKDDKGNDVLIEPTWMGFWGRVWGHQTVLIPKEDRITKPEPFMADLVNMRIRSRAQMLSRIRRPSPMRASPLDSFKVIPSFLLGKGRRRGAKLPVLLFFTKAGSPVDVTWTHLSVHREVPVPTRVTRNGTEVPAHTERRWALPHWVDGHAEVELANIHFRSALSVTSEWRTAADLAQVLSDTSLDLELLKSNFEVEVAGKVKERLTARLATLGRILNDLAPEEAALEAERMKDNLPSLDELMGRGMAGRLSPEAPPPKNRKERRDGRRT